MMADLLGKPVPQASAEGLEVEALKGELSTQLEGEVRFDKLSRALYSTDASVYQIEPLGVVVPKSRRDVVRTVQICSRHGCPITVRGGGTSQAGQAIGPGLQIDTSKYLNRILEVNAQEQWARVEPGVVIDELNAHLRPYGLKFAPDVSTSNRATLGGMMANNSSGAHSLVYGKTIDHVLEQQVVLADGSVVYLRDLSKQELDDICSGDDLESSVYRTVRKLAAEYAEEVERRFPKILRRVGGYNLDAFTDPEKPFNLCKLLVGSEGTLGIAVEAKVRLVPLPKAKVLLVIHFEELLEALAETPAILEHGPSAVEVVDRFILGHTRQNPEYDRLRGFIKGDPGGLLIVEFYGDDSESLVPRLEVLEKDLQQRGAGYYCHRATEIPAQEQIWALRKACLGLSMAMRGDAKALSFVEDTAVSPHKLRDYIERFLQIVQGHGTTAGVYAHASVGCLHVRPVVNLKTEEGIERFEAIANDIADLVLEFGGAVSGEHGDGLVRSPFIRKMFGPQLYEAFRSLKKAFDCKGILNPGKIVDAPSLTDNLRYGVDYQTADPTTYFDYSEYGGLGRSVEMCGGVGACRKKLSGTMCPSYMATREETHTTRGRANVLRLAMSGQLGATSVADEAVVQALDLCLECRACKSECPVGVDVARFKSEFLAGYWQRNGAPLKAHVLGNIAALSRLASTVAPLSNWLVSNGLVRRLNQQLLGIDSRRSLPAWKPNTLRQWMSSRNGQGRGKVSSIPVVLFNDTFTNYFEPEIGRAVVELLESLSIDVQLGEHHCCGRPLISQGLLEKAREHARHNVEALFPLARHGHKIVFCEPSCLSAVREDTPDLLRGQESERAKVVADSSMLFEEFLENECGSDRVDLKLKTGPSKILLHGHCHQRSMGLVGSTLALLRRVPGSTVIDLDAGCCGMAGSFGYSTEHYEISGSIAERRLLPAVREKEEGTVVVAAGTSCRHQVEHFAGESIAHPAMLLRSLLVQEDG